MSKSYKEKQHEINAHREAWTKSRKQTQVSAPAESSGWGTRAGRADMMRRRTPAIRRASYVRYGVAGRGLLSLPAWAAGGVDCADDGV
jgi:hypothetical protein